MSLEIGQLIEGKYRIVRLIGEGGMGAVYEGENIRINRRVAIKVLHSAFTGNAEVMQRFDREAQAAGRIGNDHILEVLDLGSLPDGDHYIVMEYLDGEPFSSRIKGRGRLTPLEVAPVIRQVLVGLNAAHHAGIVHRDLKPDNIFILREKANTRDFVKIIDFGISKFQPLAGDGMKMTRTGAVMGTPYYMSPEQASGSQEADQRSDLYSVGVILFEAVTGSVPFDAATFNQLMFKIVLAEVPTIETLVPDVDPAFSSIVSKAMARDVNHRFQSAQEFLRALDDWTSRGKAVTLPPAVDGADAGLVPAQRRAAMPSASGAHRSGGIGARTAGNWSTSQFELEHERPKRNTALIAAAAGFALLVVGGGAFAAYHALAKAPAPLPVTSAALVPAAPAISKPAPEPVQDVTPVVTPEPETPAAQPVATLPSARPAPTAAVPSHAHVSARPQRPSKPRPEPVSATPPKPAPQKPSSSSPDFGY